MSKENNSLESMLNELELYGNPMLHKSTSGWSCSVEIMAFGDGAKLSVRSGFDKDAAFFAAKECLIKVRSGIENLNSAGNGVES